MARCARCNRFMFFSSQSGYCKNCDIQILNENAEKQRMAREEAEERQRKAEDERKAEAEYQKGLQLFRSSVDSDIAKSFPHFMNAAELGHALAQTQVGGMFRDGIGVTKNIDKGTEWTRKAADQGCGMAESNLAAQYLWGLGVPKDVRTAAELYQRASDHGDEYAQWMLGKLYLSGDGVPKDEGNARAMFLKAAKNGSREALFDLIGDEERMNCSGRKQCIATLKEEFEAAFSFMKKHIRLKDADSNDVLFSKSAKELVKKLGIEGDYINDVVALKRAGKYVKASRGYMLVTIDTGELLSSVTAGWIKVLAAAGDVEDAIALGKYVLDGIEVGSKPTVSWLLIRVNIETLLSLISNQDWNGLASRCNEVGGGFGDPIKLEDIDVYAKLGR